MSELSVPNNLICNVQSLNLQEDCAAPLVSDGKHWFCPYGHIQGYDHRNIPIRKIKDKRTSVCTNLNDKENNHE